MPKIEYRIEINVLKGWTHRCGKHKIWERFASEVLGFTSAVMTRRKAEKFYQSLQLAYKSLHPSNG